jgi:betaine-aldehyde dehydrogenase
VVERMRAHLAKFKPGIPTDPATRMGALISHAQHERVLEFIAAARAEGATLVYGGGPPNDPALRNGFFIEPTVFTGVTQDMRIASQEVFGPVQAILRWSDETKMFHESTD